MPLDEIAYAGEMRSFQIDSSYTWGRAKTMRKRYEWTRMFLKTEEKSCIFKRIRIRVDRALISKITTLHVQHTFFVHFFAVTPRLRRQIKMPDIHVLWSKQVTMKFSHSF